VPLPWTDEQPRAERLRTAGFQVRFRVQLPHEAECPAFAPWFVERLNELLPAHRWLVEYLDSKDVFDDDGPRKLGTTGAVGV